MAIPATMLSRSSSSSGSSTPWLSPDASSSTWRTSYSASADLSRRTSSASTTTNRSSIPGSEPSYAHDPNAHEWWEHVLPPGQLAERLRKAQRSSSASRRRNNPALANATPSERSAWKRLSGLPREEPHHDRSASSTAASSRRSSFQGTSATLPRSALRSSLRHADSTAYSHAHHSSQPGSSAEVSSDEYTASPTGRHSPPSNLRYVFPSSTSASAQSGSSRLSGVRTTGNSPDLASSQWAASSSTSSPHAPAVDASHAASRGSYGRRMRVMSEDGMASSVFAHSNAASYRLPSSHSAIHLSHYAATQDRARPASLHHSLPDTPELSSDDGADHVHFATSSSSSSTTTTTQRTRRISTTRTTIRSSLTSPPTILRSDFDRPDQPIFAVGQDEAGSARHERHVSFDTVPEVLRRASVHETPTASHSQPAFNFGSVPGREHSSPFDTLPPRSNSTRRTRHGVRASGGRSTSFSLPGSRRNSILGDRPFEFGHAGAHTAGSSHRRTTSVPDAALLDSLNVAHKQLASAGNLAITLTRQLSAPLRPVLQMTLFLSISSLTVLSLACFLCASYMLTAWDDVSKRSHRVGQVAGKTRHTMGRTLTWGMRMLGPGSGAEGKESKAGNGDAAGAGGVQGETRKRRESASRGAVSAAGHAMLWPARIAWSGASTVAFLVTPPAVSHMFTHGREGQKTKPRSTLPPRPPLSTLLPSILFTLLLALGAGLTTFMASRKAAAAAATAGAGARTEQPASSQPYTVPSPGVQYVHLPAASPFAGGHRASGMRPRSQQSAQRVV